MLMLPAPAFATMLPSQVAVSPGSGLATVNPAGSVSVNPIPVNPLVFGFAIVNVSVVVPFKAIVDTPNALVTVGGTVTLRFAVAVLPVPPLADVTAPVVLTKSPPAAPFTSTLNTQLPLAGIVAPDKLTLLPAAVIVPLPTHAPATFAGVATTTPAGSPSVNPTPVSASVLAAGFVTVNVKLVVPFSGIRAAPNAFCSTGGISTARFAVAVFPLPPSVDVTASVVFANVPAADPVTFTLNVHVPFTSRFPPVSVTLPDPASAVIAPIPHVPVSPLSGLATVIPIGNVSVNPTPSAPPCWPPDW